MKGLPLPYRGRDPRTTRLLLVAACPALQREARQAAAMLGAQIDVMPDVEAALAWLLSTERLCTHVLAEAAIDASRIDALAGMVDEVTSQPTPLLLLGAEHDLSPFVLGLADVCAASIAAAVQAFLPFHAPPRRKITQLELRTALHSGMLRMRFQPVLDAATLRPLGVEALARLHHPDFGILHPRDFMPQAEASGQERALTGIASARTMLELRGLPNLPQRFSINVPLATLCHAQGVDRALELIAVVGISPRNVVIEVLETQLEPDLRIMGAAVGRWAEAGFRIMIDDAGPRLRHWRKLISLPFQGIKLDVSLTANPALAAEIVDAAKQRGLFVVAEGIETQDVLTRMRGLGVDAVQGFMFCRPLPARAVPIWMSSWDPPELKASA